ncbi:aldehyde dehydrogenase [Mycolicibacterium mageritense DSM 44476 = CIP 104973]|uniref:Aldehyde dehydrogenase n=1 Tax=Mycolicibacterium mageritense TaxID=53462 RepID=A0ABN5XYQ3_MYCME|nr:MAG: aldehyde dehydrogenase family protein [Mycolicibacterium mageritense]BBX31130.1 aldehyde dehydrogenase [Mycolicibacterium mageritense]CDO24879.1 aldehyde dehydrogenase [Mycolicibacterium mageritense DSM 44476 = CIP 104973]
MTDVTELLSHIDGAWTGGAAGELIDTNPAHPDQVVATGALADAAQLDRAVQAARAAARGWARQPMHARAAVLTRAADIVDAAAEEWGAELTREEGKTLAEGIGEVRRAAQILRYYGGAADREAGTVYSSPRSGEQILVTRKPIGVVGVITPFNFPIAIPAWKIAPALVYGNTVVFKPASAVPLLALRLTQALVDAGLPQGVLNLVFAGGSVGGALAEHPGVDAVTFTGSTGVGRGIAAAAAARGVPVQAEMGGKNAAVVLADADLDLAVEQVMLGAFRSSGQKCTATSRLVLDDAIADEFLAELTVRVKGLEVGDPMLASVAMGPVVSESACKYITQRAQDAVAAGATVVATAEERQSGSDNGYFVTPTVLQLPSTDAELWSEELFGPVLSVVRAQGVEQAFAVANAGEYGLSAAVFTSDLGRALAAVDDIDVGVLHVNSESAGADPHVPFGGAKRSGYGPKEQGEAAREFFTHTTTVYLRGGRA